MIAKQYTDDSHFITTSAFNGVDSIFLKIDDDQFQEQAKIVMTTSQAELLILTLQRAIGVSRGLERKESP